MKEEINFVNFRKEQGLELIQLWRKSFAHAMGIEEDTRVEVVNEHLSYFQTYKLENIRIAIEKDKNKIPETELISTTASDTPSLPETSDQIPQ